MRVLAPPLTLDGDGFTPAPATQLFGSEATAVRDGLGFTPEEVARLVKAGVTQSAKRGGNQARFGVP